METKINRLPHYDLLQPGDKRRIKDGTGKATVEKDTPELIIARIDDFVLSMVEPPSDMFPPKGKEREDAIKKHCEDVYHDLQISF